MFEKDRKWADDKLRYIIEHEGSWSDVVEQVFPMFESYCEPQNAKPKRKEDYMKITPEEIDKYMMEGFFELGYLYLENGGKRPKGM